MPLPPDQMLGVDPGVTQPVAVGAQEEASPAAAPAMPSPPSPAPPVTPQTLQPASFSPMQLVVTQAPKKDQLGIGFSLASIVLSMTAGSIILFVIYLAVMDITIGSDIREQYQHILVPNRMAAEMMTTAGLQQLTKDLTDAKTNPTGQLSAESQQNSENIMKLVQELPSVGNEQKSKMGNCIPLPKPDDTERKAKLDDCLTITAQIRQAMLVAADAVADAKVAGDATYKIGEQRKDLHTFWVQAAQLVLLNLLLPLLTALFGYIFGRQQEHQQQQQS